MQVGLQKIQPQLCREKNQVRGILIYLLCPIWRWFRYSEYGEEVVEVEEVAEPLPDQQAGMNLDSTYSTNSTNLI
jgi:hypothetical protein